MRERHAAPAVEGGATAAPPWTRPARESAAPRRGILRLAPAVVLWVLSIDTAFLAVQLLLCQVRVVVVAPSERRLVMDDGVARTMERSPFPADVVVQVDNASDPAGPARVEVSPFQTPRRARLSEAAGYAPTGDFDVVGSLRAGGVWRSARPGASLRWTGRVSGVGFGLRCAPDAGRACVEATALPRRCHDLSQCTNTVQIDVPSTRTAFHALVPWWRGRFTIVPDRSTRLDTVTVSLGGRDLAQERAVLVNESFPVDVPGAARAAALWSFAWNGLCLLAQGLLPAVVLALLGASLALPVAPRTSPLEFLLLAYFLGEGLSANVTTALAYLMSAGEAWTLVLSAGAVAGAWQLRRGGLAGLRTCVRAMPPAEAWAAPWLAMIAVASTAAVAFPALTFPGWFVGHGYTDAVDYATWASLVKTAPIDPDLGGIRDQDFVRVALTALTLGADTRSAVVAEAARLWLLLPVLAWALLRRFRVSPEASLAGAALAAHGSGLFQVFTFCYLPHYEVIVFCIACVWAIAWFTDDGAPVGGARNRLWSELVLAGIFSAAAGLYPYQAFPVAAFGLVWLLVGVRQRDGALASLARVACATAMFCNTNLRIVFGFSEGAMQYRQALNALARNLVFPWYDTFASIGILAGVDDLVRNSLHRAALFQELFAGLPRIGVWLAALDRVLAAVVAPASGVIGAGALAAIGWLLVRRRDRVGLTAALSLLLGAAMSAALYAQDDAYFAVKTAMTLSGLAIVPVAGVLATMMESRHAALHLGGTALALVFVLLSLRATFFDTLPYALNRESMAVERLPSHVPVHGRALRDFERWLRDVPPGRRFVFQGAVYDRWETDGDFVTYNRMLQMLEGHDVRYGADESRRYTRIRGLIGYSGAEPPDAFDYVVQFGHCHSLPMASTVVLDRDLFCVRAMDRAP